MRFLWRLPPKKCRFERDVNFFPPPEKLIKLAARVARKKIEISSYVYTQTFQPGDYYKSSELHNNRTTATTTFEVRSAFFGGYPGNNPPVRTVRKSAAIWISMKWQQLLFDMRENHFCGVRILYTVDDDENGERKSEERETNFRGKSWRRRDVHNISYSDGRETLLFCGIWIYDLRPAESFMRFVPKIVS